MGPLGVCQFEFLLMLSSWRRFGERSHRHPGLNYVVTTSREPAELRHPPAAVHGLMVNSKYISTPTF